jgi:hypothetical protein
MTLEQRLERLERQSRWMRRIGAVGLALVAAVFLMGQDKAKELPDLEVRSLKVRDKDWKVRAALEMHGDGGVRLLMRDAKGVERVSLGVSEYGVAGVELADEKGEKWVRLATYPKGAATLTFENRNKASQLYLGIWEDSTMRLSFGRKEKAVLDLWVNDGTPSLDLIASSGKGGIRLVVLDDGSSSVSVSDTEGTVIWQAPKD